MRSFLPALALLGAASLTPLAHADTLSTFAATNFTYANGATATGDVVIDATTGVFESASFTYTLSGVSTAYDLYGSQTNGFDNNTQSFFYFEDVAGDDLLIDVAGSTLIGYAGGTVCSGASNCGGYLGNQESAAGVYNAQSTGSLTFVSSVTTAAATPEPSSFVLLGTGLLGVAGAARRKFRQA